ncbi:proton pump-interactor 1 isoform X1 [Coffea arabica]|uniref:Proton pump-interactor 1 isoform X1 n=2 Tax=Coffea arabica TaxID=13443 RepID=A0ABM4UDD0_COFAR|nr:proton pump-interactor 1-like isoform X1 [Coffea arabica]
MGVEVVESKLPHVSGETAGEENSLLKENGKISNVMGLSEPITFGSHGMDEPVKGEKNKAAEVNFPKDAVDEWPAPKQIHSFYFVRYRLHEDQKLKAKLDQADTELQKKNQARSQLIEKLRKLKADRAQKIAFLKDLNKENRQYRELIDEKKKEREPLQQALGQLHGGRDRGSGICSSEEELNHRIKSLQYHIQHESITLNEEKQILREIKQLEGTREKVIANAALRAKIQESMGEKEALEDQMKLIRVDMDGVRKDQQVVLAKRKQLEEEKEAIEKEIKSLEEELTAVTQKRDKTFENIQELRKQREEGNSAFYQNRSLLNKARGLAEKKDVEGLKELSETEVDKFISSWSGSKGFREDYERRILPSLDGRQLSRDGRMRNPDEKPLVVVEVAPAVVTDVVPKTNVKQPKEDTSTSKLDATPVQKVQKEKSTKQQKDAGDGEEFFMPEKKQNDPPPKVNEIDELKLKEVKREEEIAKAKQAMERKKKLSEKAAAKAAIKAQKEAEKKIKEREKRAKKKAGANVAATQETEEQTEAPAEVVEVEKGEETVETPALPKSKDRKENAVRHRIRPRGAADSLPKAFLRRKKATNYWLWAAPAAALALLLLIGIGYNYLL